MPIGDAKTSNFIFGKSAALEANQIQSGLNLVGLKRRGFTKDEIGSLRVAYRQLFAEEGLLSERIEDVAKQFHDLEAVMEIVEFMRADSSRGLTQPRSTNG